MYDWPERRDEVNAEWAAIRDRLLSEGIDAPEGLTRDFDDLHELWRRPNLLFAQTCWGPMELGLAGHVQVIGQPSYDGIEGGEGPYYSSAIVMRRDLPPPLTPPLKGEGDSAMSAPPSPLRGGVRGGGIPEPGMAHLPLDLLRGQRLAYNGPDSMSGIIGLTRDLEAIGENLALFSERIVSGGHRLSVRAVAEGRADVAAIDCLSWALAQRYESAAKDLRIVGWTAKRKGLPFITAKTTPAPVLAALRAAVT